MTAQKLTATLALAALMFAFVGQHVAYAQGVTLGGIEFRLRSAILSSSGGHTVLHLSLIAENKGKDPIGVFLYPVETLVSLDTGVSFHGSEISAISGVGKCFNYNREDCIKGMKSYLTTIPAGVTDNVIIEFVPRTDEKTQEHAAKLLDLTATIYLIAANGEAGYVPLSFSDMPLRNMVE